MGKEDGTLAAEIESILARTPRSRWRLRRPMVIVAVGPSRVQTKLVTELGEAKDTVAAATRLHEGAGRFFLANGAPLVTGVGRLTRDGAWAAAYEGPVLDAITSGCRAAGVRLAGIVPSVFIAPLAMNGETIVIRDGQVVAEVVVESGELRQVHRRLGTADDPSRAAPTAVTARLANLGEQSARFAEAYGAAIASPSAWTLRSTIAEGHARSAIPRWRSAIAVAAACAGIGFAIVAPWLGARLKATRAEHALAALAGEQATAMDVRQRVEQVTLALDEVARFSEDRRSPLALLAALTAALPAASAIVTLKVDSAGGTIVALAPRAALIVTQLERVEAIVAPEIIGPVSREVVAGRELERVTVRFRLAGRAPSGESS